METTSSDGRKDRKLLGCRCGAVAIEGKEKNIEIVSGESGKYIPVIEVGRDGKVKTSEVICDRKRKKITVKSENGTTLREVPEDSASQTIMYREISEDKVPSEEITSREEKEGTEK